MSKALSVLFASTIVVCWATVAGAWSTYSAERITDPNGDSRTVGNCVTCHGAFRATDETNSTPYLQEEYLSLTDGRPWRVWYTDQPVDEGDEPRLNIGLHDVHRRVINDKLSRGSCDTCHTDHIWVPAYLGSSSAAPELGEGYGCVGCHGRVEDAGGDNVSAGLGAGLRQHHTTAGIATCKSCHLDADPAKFTPVGEHVQPPFYKANTPEFPNMPTDPCNWRRDEDYVGKRFGLDNDGDGRTDIRDRDCRPFNFFKRMGLTK